jgi:hypothetical protein
MDRKNKKFNNLLVFYIYYIYNMTIDILGYKIDLEILILMGIIYLIMVAHTLFSVTKVEGVNEFIKEGFEAISDDLKKQNLI